MTRDSPGSQVPLPVRFNSRRTVGAILVFASLCSLYGAWPVWRAFFPLEIDLKEPWNAYHADAIINGGTLYPDLTSLVANNYPPLWYFLTGFISRFGIDAIYVGRTLSLLATISLAVMVAFCIRRFNAGWSAALLGSLFFFGLTTRYADWYVGMNDPNLLALAIMMIGLLWFLHGDPKQGAEKPLLVMVLAGFFKHSLIAIPATVLCLLARRNWRLAIRALLVAGCAAVVGIGAFTVLYGRAFIDQIFFYPRELLIERAWDSLGRLGSVAPGLLVWSIWAWRDRGSEAVRFTATFIFFALGTYLMQKLGAGTDVNAQFELNVALAIGVALAFDRIASVPLFWGHSVETRRLAVIGVLALGLLGAPGLEPYLLVASAEYRAQFFRNAGVMRSEVRRIAAIPGPVWCSIDTVCRAAGKPLMVDVFFVGQKGVTGGFFPGEFTGRLVAQGVRYERIDARAAMGSLQRQLFYGRSQQISR